MNRVLLARAVIATPRALHAPPPGGGRGEDLRLGVIDARVAVRIPPPAPGPRHVLEETMPAASAADRHAVAAGFAYHDPVHPLLGLRVGIGQARLVDPLAVLVDSREPGGTGLGSGRQQA